MEINSSSKNLFYQTTTPNNKNTINKDSSQFTTLLSSNQEVSKSSSSVKYDTVIDLESVEFKEYPYYPNSLESKIRDFRQHKFYEAQAQLPWEEQFVYPNLQFVNYTPDDYISDEYSKNADPLGYAWTVALRSATNGNKYDGAPEFKAFVDKWMDKGLSEFEALERAMNYADAGLLDYGSQKAWGMYSFPLTDTKQHGLWLIDNPPLKQAILKVFDSLENLGDLSSLESAIFHGGPEYQNEIGINFEELLKKYGVKLEDLKQKDPQFAQENPEVFSGDINLKNDNSAESQAYNNFIFKTLIGFFKDRIESLDRWAPQDPNVDFTSTKESINLLIENFQGKVDEYNTNIENGKSIGTK